jgi:hypothetical protein
MESAIYLNTEKYKLGHSICCKKNLLNGGDVETSAQQQQAPSTNQSLISKNDTIKNVFRWIKLGLQCFTSGHTIGNEAEKNTNRKKIKTPCSQKNTNSISSLKPLIFVMLFITVVSCLIAFKQVNWSSTKFDYNIFSAQSTTAFSKITPTNKNTQNRFCSHFSKWDVMILAYLLLVNIASAFVIYLNPKMTNDEYSWPNLYYIMTNMGGVITIIVGTVIYDKKRICKVIEIGDKNVIVSFVLNLFWGLLILSYFI